MLVNLELKIDYMKLFYQSGNRHKGPFKFYEFGSMTDIYQRVKTNRMSYEEAESKLQRFNGLIGILMNTPTRKEYYKKKKD